MYASQIMFNGKSVQTHKKFSDIEDQRLRELVGQFGPRKWKSIALFMPGRTGRQCRDRYSNYLCPGYFNGEWTREEDKLLAEKYDEFGTQWSKIAFFFEGRTPNSIKNRWNYCVSKMNKDLKNQIIYPLSSDQEDKDKKLSKTSVPNMDIFSIDYLLSKNVSFPNCNNQITIKRFVQ